MTGILARLGGNGRVMLLCLAVLGAGAGLASGVVTGIERFASVGAALGGAGLAAQHLELELTEGTLIDGSPQVDASLRALRALGVRITVDDFGTGYASVSYLRASRSPGSRSTARLQSR